LELKHTIHHKRKMTKTLVILILLFNGELVKEKLVLPIEMDVHKCLTFSEKYRETVSTYKSDITTQGWYLNDGRGTIQGFIC